MKILTSFFCFCIIFTFACAKTTNPKISENKLHTTENSQNLQSKFDEPILEVTSDYWGVIQMTGRVIDIRLFEDGIAEYDSYYTAGLTQVKAEDVKVAKRRLIREEQFKDFIDFLTSKEFLNAKNRYTKKNCFAHDAGRDIEIKFKYGNSKKQIAVIHNCESLPEAVSKLIEKIKKITNQNSA